jgi:hypothetical protein
MLSFKTTAVLDGSTLTINLVTPNQVGDDEGERSDFFVLIGRDRSSRGHEAPVGLC